MNDVYHIVLPRYLSPFSIHTSVIFRDSDKIKREFKNYFGFKNHPYIPIRIDPADCERLIQLRQQEDFDKEFEQNYIRRIDDFIMLQDYFEKNKIEKKVSDYIDKLRSLRDRIFLLDKKIYNENKRNKSSNKKLTDYQTERQEKEFDLEKMEEPINKILGTKSHTELSKDVLARRIIQYRRKLIQKKAELANIMKELEKYEEILNSSGPDFIQQLKRDGLDSINQEETEIDYKKLLKLLKQEETLKEQLDDTEKIEEWLDDFYK